MSQNDTAKIAVLIDGENMAAKYAAAIFEEIASFGEASVRRIYGDFSGDKLKGWVKVMADLAIIPQQQFQNTVGKNADDIALVIDAMDLLHEGRFDAFFLVSSDSDFTRLASRIREQAVHVYGVGEKKTPKPFRMACNQFIYAENLLGEEVEQDGKKLTLAHAEQLIGNVFDVLDQDHDQVNLGHLGSAIRTRYSDFDHRNYGHKTLSGLIKSTKKFVTEGSGGKTIVKRK